MNAQLVRIRLIEMGLLQKDLARQAGIDYDRLQKVLHGYRRPRPLEIRAIALILSLPEADLLPLTTD